jgi:hypothetical protein
MNQKFDDLLLLDSGLQLRLRVPFVLCAYLLAFFPRFLIRVWSTLCVMNEVSTIIKGVDQYWFK